MNTLTPCSNCSYPIHESASACPKCGQASQAISAQGGVPFTSYDQVPWYRKRWFAFVCIVVFIPALILIAFTGDIYFPKNGQVKTFAPWYKFFILGIFILMMALQLTSG